jgi:hypothetical protein
LEQGLNCLRHAFLCSLRKHDAAASTVSRVACPLYQAVPLHASEHLRHRRLLYPGKAGEITLRACITILQRDQYRQVANTEAQRFKA